MDHLRESSIQFENEKKLVHKVESKAANANEREEKEIKDQPCILASPTPEKLIHPPRIRNKYHCCHATQVKESSEFASEESEGQRQIPDDEFSMENVQHNPLFSYESLKQKTDQISEKYNILVDMFDHMVVSTRLLRLKKRLSNFQNISKQIEILTKRKFSVDYLSQMNYLIPDAIQIEKILVLDEISLCMKSDIRVSLNVNAFKSSQRLRQASYVDLRQVFRNRLLDFIKSHPEGADIPRTHIPEISSHVNITEYPDHLATTCPVDQNLSVPADDNLLAPSHLSLLFRGYFSKKVLDPDELMSEACSVSISSIGQEDSSYLLKEAYSSAISPANSQPVNGTPAKVVSGQVILMTETPAQSTPDRPAGSPSVTSTRRALRYSPSKSNNLLPLENSSGRQQVLASLSGTVNAISSFIGSSNSSTITKQELVHKILSYNCDLEDPHEVERQLGLLEELVPGWIRRMTTSTGDLLYWISRSSDMNAVRARLVATRC